MRSVFELIGPISAAEAEADPSLRLRSGHRLMVAGSRKNSDELNRNKSQQYQQIDSQSPKREPDGSSHFDPWHTSVFSLIRVNSELVRRRVRTILRFALHVAKSDPFAVNFLRGRRVLS